VPEQKHERFTAMYAPLNMMNPMQGGLALADDPSKGQYTQPRAMLSGGGGLVSTVADYLAFVRMLVNGGQGDDARILKPATLALMRTNQLAPGIGVNFSVWAMPSTVFGLGFALRDAAVEGEPPNVVDEYLGRHGGCTVDVAALNSPVCA
jgi:CubicO group peptidase (beta-lactamase class C family)